MEVRALSSLYVSPLNTLTDATEDSFEDLKEELKKGQHSTLLIMKDGEIIGGKHRFLAMQELGMETAKCIVLSIGKEEGKGFYAYLDGEKVMTQDGPGEPPYIPQYYESADALKMDYSKSHNHNTIYYKKDALQRAMLEYPELAWGESRLPIAETKRVNESLKNFMIDDTKEKKEDMQKDAKDEEIEVKCPSCNHKFSVVI